MSSSQSESVSNDDLSLYVQMLLGFGTVPKWHNFLSTLFIWLIPTGFIIIPSTLFVYSQDQSTNNDQSQGKLILEVNEPLFAIGVSMVYVGVIGMFVLSRFQFRNQIPLKDNYFWLHNKYYLPVAECSIIGLILLLNIIFEFRKGRIDSDRHTIAAICVICSIKVLFSGLTIWSYLKTRQVKKEHGTRNKAEDSQTEDPYVRMLLGFASIPAWHILLSTFLIWLITTGFITIPPGLISIAEDSNDSSLFKQFAQSEPQFAIGISIFFLGFIGMFGLSRYRYLKNNHFWLYHKYYRRMVEAGIYGVISFLVSNYVYGNVMDPPTIAVICVTCIVTALFGLLALWSYVKMRRARMEHETPHLQPHAEKPQIEEPKAEQLQA